MFNWKIKAEEDKDRMDNKNEYSAYWVTQNWAEKCFKTAIKCKLTWSPLTIVWWAEDANDTLTGSQQFLSTVKRKSLAKNVRL